MELIAYYALVPIIIGGFKERIALGSLLGLIVFTASVATMMFWSIIWPNVATGFSHIFGFIACVIACLLVFYLDDDWKGFKKQL